MADKPPVKVKPNPRLPMYDVDRGRGLDFAEADRDRAISEHTRRQARAARESTRPLSAAEGERRLREIEQRIARRSPTRPEATYPRRESLTPRGATATRPSEQFAKRHADRAKNIVAKADEILRKIDLRREASKTPGLRERVSSAVRSNAKRILPAAGLLSKVMPPVAVAGAAHDLVGILHSGDRALAAKAKVMAEKRYTRENYGTEAKARRSRIEGPRR